MAKKPKDESQSPKKLIQDKIITHLLQEFQQLETLVGKKEWAKRLKKAAKTLTQGLQFEEATEEDLAAETQPAVEATSGASAKKAAPSKSAAKTAVKKPARTGKGTTAKKTASAKSNPKAAPKKRVFKKA